MNDKERLMFHLREMVKDSVNAYGEMPKAILANTETEEKWQIGSVDEVPVWTDPYMTRDKYQIISKRGKHEIEYIQINEDSDCYPG